MSEPVLLVLVDGMRPDALQQCKSPLIDQICRDGSYTMAARTIFPSVTLPCHASLFLGVDPQRHGITTNFWMPQVRPVDGIFEVAHAGGKTCGMFYDWQELRDLSRPGTLDFSHFHRQSQVMEIEWEQEREMTRAACSYMARRHPDFVFVYFGCVDEVGHRFGWMSREYLMTLEHTLACVEELAAQWGREAHLILTADHGGHGQSHGTQLKEDMTIPLLGVGPRFQPGHQWEGADIKDIAPTVAQILGLSAPQHWVGTSLLEK